MQRFFKLFKRSFLFCLFLAGGALSQAGLEMKSPVRLITVEKIFIEGNKLIQGNRVLNVLNVEEGGEYYPQVLRMRVRESIKNLHDLNWFSNISADISYPDTVEGVHLTFRVEELPSLGTVEIKGNKKVMEDDIQEALNILEGQMISRAVLERERQKILELYRDKGYQLAEVKIISRQNEETGLIDVTYKIHEGRKIKVRRVAFQGNQRIKSGKLRRKMETKQKSWFFGAGGEFKEEEFRESRDSLINYYQKNGFLDAEIKSFKTSYTPDKRFLDIEIQLSEGSRYLFGGAKFNHNDIMTEKALESQVLLDSGEVVDITKLEATKFKVEVLFRDIGHLFVQVQEEKTYQDSLLFVTYHVNEGSIAHVHKVHIRGNSKTRDKVIRRELKIFPGDIFNQSLVMRSQREVMQLNFFDEVMPNFEPVGDDEVNLVFKVKEKEAGTGTFSAGAAYSQREKFVGTLGLQIPNFMGKGQRADLQLELGRLKQLYKIGFTEPWFMDTPTLLGGDIYWRRDYNYYYQEDNPIYGYEYAIEYGFTANMGRRLTWPDDFFTVYGHYNLSQNDNGRPSDKDDYLQKSGLSSSIGLTIIRDDKDLPIFPTEGSRYTLSYNKYGIFGGNFDFAKYRAKVEWWFPTIHKLVLGIESELGIIGGKRIQQWSLFSMGGLLGFNGKMRGFKDGKIGRDIIGRSFFSLVSELTYPIAPNVFYIHGFFDMGNVYGDVPIASNPAAGSLGNPLDDIDFTDLLMDYGLGFRLVIPMMGIMGFDFGWQLGSRYRDGVSIAPTGMKTNFVIEAPY